MLTKINSHMGSVENNLSAALTAAQMLIPAGSTFKVGGVDFTQATLIQKIQSLLANYQAVTSLESQLKQARVVRNAANPGSVTFLGSLASTVESLFGTGPELSQFGFSLPKTPSPLTGEQLVARAAKSDLTRQARGTKGKVQKAAITGVPSASVVVSTHVTTPGSPSVASAPNGASSSAAPAVRATGAATGTP